VNLSRILIGLIGLLVLLQNFGVSITPLLTALGVGGLAVALALQDTLSNFFAGLQIIATKKVKPGDFVRLESGEEGYVEDIDWRHTSIRQLRNNMVLVPNSKLVNSVLTNYYYPQQELSIIVEMGVSYSSDLRLVEEVTIEVAREVLRDVDGGVPEFEPFIRFHTFNDYRIDFSIILRVREFTDQYFLRHEFLKRLKDRYASEGIEIPFPTLDWAEKHSSFETGIRARRRA
jgi:small-conductance mechanosensitive channel